MNLPIKTKSITVRNLDNLFNCTLDGNYTIVDHCTFAKRVSYGFSTTSSGRGFNVSDCAIRHCSCGGLLSRSARITGCLFEQNNYPFAARDLNESEYGLIVVEDCLIRDNYREGYFIGTYYQDVGLLELNSNVDMNRCVIYNNEYVVMNSETYVESVALIAGKSRCRITNCLVANNSIRTTNSANLIYLHSGSNIVQNNTIVNNLTSSSTHSELPHLLRASGSINLYYNLFYGNEGHSWFIDAFNPSYDNVMFNAMQDTLLGQTGNFRSDQDSIGPRFVAPTTFAGARLNSDSTQLVAAADWHLSSGSSCINAGHPYAMSLHYQLTTDLDGLNRISGGHIDIGCYEYPEADAEQHIVWDQTLDAYLSDGQMILSASASSGLPVSYLSSNNAVASVNGDTLVFHTSGRCAITATQSGDSIWLPANNVVRPLLVRGDSLVVHDTIWPTDTLTYYDTVVATTYDTVVVYDTVSTYDTLTYYDTAVVSIYDTVIVYDTVTIYDTIQLSIEDVDITSSFWNVDVKGEYVSVIGAEGETISIFDALGRQMYVHSPSSADVRFRMPSSALYLIKVGSSPAKKITIIR